MDAELFVVTWEPEDREGMDPRPYITIANDVWDHPKIVALNDPDTAKEVWFRMMTYSNQYRTDGKIHKNVAKKFKKRLVEKLLKVGLLEHTKDPDIYLLHDYLKHQKSKEQLDRLSAAKSGNGTKGAHKRWHVARNMPDQDCKLCIEEAMV